MDKEEVLKKAQSKKRNSLDEMEMDILLRSNHIGLLVGLIACLIVMAINIYFDQPYQDIYGIYCSIVCAQYVYKWRRQREKTALFYAILWGFTSVLLFVVYFMKIV